MLLRHYPHENNLALRSLTLSLLRLCTIATVCCVYFLVFLLFNPLQVFVVNSVLKKTKIKHGWSYNFFPTVNSKLTRGCERRTVAF